MPRVATASDLDGVAGTLAAAFEQDPVWRWALPDRDALFEWWRFLVAGALRYPHVWVEGDYAAVAVWIPPGGTELTAEEEERAEPLLRELIGDRTAEVLTMLEQFDAVQPREEPHYYLSLLGVQTDHRGQGLGMALVADNLATMDVQGIPAYLESTNPAANRRRYERAGFARIDEFTTPGGQTVEAMWREPGRSRAIGKSC
jgi:GNAT superfamily N-acetyltransferase